MTKTQLTSVVAAKNNGDSKEWTFCDYMDCPRTTHDSKPYDRFSDCEKCDMRYSIKSSAFTLMSSSLCNGYKDFDSIWNLYAEKVHSNRFVYISNDYMAYTMTLSEFKSFVYTFCYMDRDSGKNGGACKIRCLKETKKMIKWLENAAKVI